MTPEQKLLILDTWTRSGLSANDFAALVGLNRLTLYNWKKRFEEAGPAGLVEQTRKGSTGSKAPELTKRTVLMLKKAHPDWGCQRLSDMLYRGPGLPASANTVARILREAGYTLEESPTSPHPDKVRSFERATPNQMWQTDLFTFMLKRQNRRLHLVAFMDDHSRYIVGYCLHASSTAPVVIEAFRAAVAAVGVPQEVLTDNGPQYITWRGTSRFAAELSKLGVKHIVASPRRPRTLGKVERFWGTLWRECLDAAVFIDLADAQKRVGHFIDYYNFQRPHQGLAGLAPADRFFGSAPQMLALLKARVHANAFELARSGAPKTPFYLTGQVGGKPFSVHAEGERVYMIGQNGERTEVDLAATGQVALNQPSAVPGPSVPPAPVAVPEPVAAHGVVTDLVDEHEAEPAPGTSPLDAGLRDLVSEFGRAPGGAEATGGEQ
jgi:transposase InsO family protein